MKEKMRKWMKEKEPEMARFLQRLVREPSLAGDEAGAQALIEERLRELGAQIDVWEPGEEALISHPYFCSPRSDFTGSPNVVGLWKGVGGGKSLLLNGHIDVVPVGDRQQWNHSPFSGMIEDGKLYGRGVTDMKGGLVAMLIAVECIQAFHIPLKGDVIFQSVVEEESGGAGTLSALIRGYVADGAIIPEPTDLRIFPKQQGSIWFRIVVKGKSAHGGTRYEGVSAIEKSMVVLEAIQQLEKVRNMKITDPLYDNVPIPIPINLGTIQGGDWPSTVPDQVEITGRMGVAPEEVIQDAQGEMVMALQGIEEDWFKENPLVLQWYGARWLPSTLEENHPLLGELKSSYQKLLGQQPVIEASPWGTDGGLLNKVGNIPVVVFGPGITGMAHYPNEYIELNQIGQCALVLVDTIINWCEVEL